VPPLIWNIVGKSMKKRELLTQILMVAALLLLIGMIVQLLPIIMDLIRRADESNIVDQIHAVGWRGVPALISLAVLEVVIPFIPAPAVGVITGLSYGVYWGMLIFLSGFALGNLFVMVYMRQLKSFIKQKRKNKPAREISNIKERIMTLKKPEYVAFFFTLIPFASSFGPYLFAETKVLLPKYILAVVLGNIPSAILYMYIGDHLSRGQYITVIVIVALTISLIACVIVFRKKLIEMVFASGK